MLYEVITKTLGIAPGQCAMFNPALTEEDGSPIKVPHMGWNRLKVVRETPLLTGIDAQAEFYFVHFV